MLSELVEEFLLDYLKRRPYIVKTKRDNQRVTTMNELIKSIAEVEMVIRDNKDKTPEEIVDLIIKDTIKQYENIREKYGVPGYSVSSKVGNVDVEILSGKTSTDGFEISEDTLFDVASITKIYTQIVVYNLIKDGFLKRSDKIKDLDNRFINLDNITVGDILTFSVEFMTPSRIDDKKTYDDALSTLYNTTVVQKRKYNYNDIGLMVMKEVIEKLTGKTFNQLVEQYIITPLNLKNTYLIVPEDRYSFLTGTPNAKIGHVTDMKANLSKDGYSGHAGVFTNSSDLSKTLSAAHSGVILPNSIDARTPSKLYGKNGKKRDYVGKMGNTYVAHIDGIDKSFVDSVDPLDTFAVAGSTRTNAAVSSDSAYTILFNPSSISEEEAKFQINKMNEEKIKNNSKPIDLNNAIKHYSVNGDSEYNYIDPRSIMPLSSMEDAVRKMAELTIKLRFLDYVIKKSEKDYETTVIKHVG